MTSYAINILNCSECKNDFHFLSVRSCNTIDATFFTDGSTIGPMYDPGVLLVGCPHCQHIWWLDEVRFMGSFSDEKFSDTERENIPYANKVYYMSVVAQNLWRNDSEEKRIRILGWQEYNRLTTDHGRETSPHLIYFNDEMISGERKINRLSYYNSSKRSIEKINYDNDSNLKVLINILSEKDESEILLKAEVYRHLGKFSESIGLLEQEKVNSRFDIWKETIIKLAQNKQTKIEPLKRVTKKY